jgi:hypothetical protein
MKLYLKIFLFTGIFYGLWMGIFHGVSKGAMEGLVMGVISGLVFGLFMSLILGTMHRVYSKKVSKKQDGDVGPHQARDVVLHLGKDAALEKCLQALPAIKAKPKKVDKESGLIIAKTKTSWKSFGERITISLHETAAETTAITIESAPTVTTTMVDYGKGYQNVETVLDQLKA